MAVQLSPFLDDLAVEWLVIQGTDLHLLLTMYHHLLSTLQTGHSSEYRLDQCVH